jgi:hypothetical protein
VSEPFLRPAQSGLVNDQTPKPEIKEGWFSIFNDSCEHVNTTGFGEASPAQAMTIQ